MLFRNLYTWPKINDAPHAASEDVGGLQLLLARGIAFILLTGTAVLTFYARITLPVVPGFLAIYATAMIIFSFIVAFLLLIKGSIEEQSDSIRLGRAYLFMSFIMLAQLLAYSGAIMPNQLIGGPATAFWLWVFWHAGFALSILYYAWAIHRPTQPKVFLFPTIVSSVLIAACAIFDGVDGLAPTAS